MGPAVSIILPIYNTEKYLGQCLDSICAQTLESLQIICIDDGSTDSSGAIMDSFAEKDSRMEVIHKENGGYGKGVNTGLVAARGQYIGIVEPDDYVDVSMFEKLYRAAEAADFPDVVKAAYSRVCHPCTEREAIVPCFYLHNIEHVGVRFTLDQEAEFLFHHPSIWTAIYRRDFLDSSGIRMKEIPGAGWADNPWLIETMVSAKSIVYVDEPVYFYREFEVGSSSSVKDPSIIYGRWLDMDKILRRKRVKSPRILEGHYSRGCAYIEMLNNDFDVNRPDIREAIKKMVVRMDYDAIMQSTRILPEWKSAYEQHVSPKRLAASRLLRAARRISYF